MSSSSIDFAASYKADDDRFTELLEWPLWDQLKADQKRRQALDDEDLRKRKEERRNAFTRPTITGDDLVGPDEEGSLICMRVAKGDVVRFRQLFEEEPSAEVYYLYALQVSAEYHLQLTERDFPERSYDEDEEGQWQTS